ncbi:hypothetical protein AC579_7804 [Pseudocercospora musae]|uniref:BZIP domain-containing protein n=1 Tax=Pseudocercospora musae TaxID=113226 RepID=A0A139IJ00_9PEZI|nr:hypothetical protein AC579_7804 [Pseudocercospora musae]
MDTLYPTLDPSTHEESNIIDDHTTGLLQPTTLLLLPPLHNDEEESTIDVNKALAAFNWPPAAAAAAPTTTSPPRPDPDQDQEKLRIYRERNRIAAAKTRRKKKSSAQELERRARDVFLVNERLKQEERCLRDVLSTLRFTALAHDPGTAGCGCVDIHGYNRRRAEEIAGMGKEEEVRWTGEGERER